MQNRVTTPISIPDNRRGGENLPSLSDEQLADLKTIANKSLSKLCKEDNTLLVFPEQLSDDLKNKDIFTIKGEKIFTYNVMGFIGKGDTRLRIYSRFDTDERDYFLHYMLAKVLDINLFNMPYTSDSEQEFDILICLFPAFLSRAMAKGLYRRYITFERNDANIRGPIDIARHIRKNIPFTGSIAYQSREYSGDNEITELVRHTIEYINTLPGKSTILDQDEDTKRFVAEIRAATPAFNPQEMARIVFRNLRPRIHPYYYEYEPLRKLCIQILMNEGIKYGEREDKVYGVLFDGAWLWEEYLNKVLSSALCLKHPILSRKQNNKICLFKDTEGYYRYPDYYNKNMVLDAKYKMNKNSDITDLSQIDNEDLAQVISYMYILETLPQVGGFIVPGKGEGKRIKEEKTLNGRGGKILLANLPIPNNADSYKDFCAQLKNNEKDLLKGLKEYNVAD